MMTSKAYREMVERFLGSRVEGRVEEVMLNRSWMKDVAPGSTARAITAYREQEKAKRQELNGAA